MTRRASEIGFFTVETPDTAPHLLLVPSMILASISTVPFAVRADPRPELNKGSVSNCLTCHKKGILLCMDQKLKMIMDMCVSERGMERHTTSSTTSRAEALERSAEMPRLRQRVRSCLASS